MAHTNINWISMTDDAIVKHIGSFIKEERIAKNKTQSEIAKITGLNRYTIGKIEKGGSVTLKVLIQVLRALDILHVLDHLVTTTNISPLEAVKLKEKKRKRATSTKQKPTSQSNW